MSSLVLYTSRQGATKQYAEWISQELGAEMVEIEKCSPEMLSKASNIVIGAGIYIHKWAALPFVMENQKNLEGKKLSFFIVGLNPPSPKKFEDVLTQADVRFSNAGFFSFRGGLDFPKLNFSDKLIQIIVYLIFFKFRKSENEETRYIRENFFKGFSLVKKEDIAALISFIK
ncbi:MAG: flavodoxin domain-containing protein [Brevinema sp.]